MSNKNFINENEKEDVGSEKFSCDLQYLKNLTPKDIDDLIEFNGNFYYSILFEETEIKYLIKTDLVWKMWPEIVYKKSLEHGPEQNKTSDGEEDDIEDVANKRISEQTLVVTEENDGLCVCHEYSQQSAMNGSNISVNECNEYSQHYAENIYDEIPSPLIAVNNFNEYSQQYSNNEDQGASYYNDPQQNENEYLESVQDNGMEECNEDVHNNCEVNTNFEPSQPEALVEYNAYHELSENIDQSDLSDDNSDSSSIRINIYREYQRHNALNIEYGEEYESLHHSDYSSECSSCHNEVNSDHESSQKAAENRNHVESDTKEIDEYNEFAQHDLDNAYLESLHHRPLCAYQHHAENVDDNSEHISLDSSHHSRIQEHHEDLLHFNNSEGHVGVNGEHLYFESRECSNNNNSENNEGNLNHEDLQYNSENSDSANEYADNEFSQDNLENDDYASTQHETVYENNEINMNDDYECPLIREALKYYKEQEKNSVEKEKYSYHNNTNNADDESSHRKLVNENFLCSYYSTAHEFKISARINIANGIIDNGYVFHEKYMYAFAYPFAAIEQSSQSDQHAEMSDQENYEKKFIYTIRVADENVLSANMVRAKVTATENITGILYDFYVEVTPTLCWQFHKLCAACSLNEERRVIGEIILHLAYLHMFKYQKTLQTN